VPRTLARRRWVKLLFTFGLHAWAWRCLASDPSVVALGSLLRSRRCLASDSRNNNVFCRWIAFGESVATFQFQLVSLDCIWGIHNFQVGVAGFYLLECCSMILKMPMGAYGSLLKLRVDERRATHEKTHDVLTCMCEHIGRLLKLRRTTDARRTNLQVSPSAPGGARLRGGAAAASKPKPLKSRFRLKEEGRGARGTCRELQRYFVELLWTCGGFQEDMWVSLGTLMKFRRSTCGIL